MPFAAAGAVHAVEGNTSPLMVLPGHTNFKDQEVLRNVKKNSRSAWIRLKQDSLAKYIHGGMQCLQKIFMRKRALQVLKIAL